MAGMLIYALAGALCILLTSETLLVSYSHRYRTGPPSSKLLCSLAELLKLCIASWLYYSEPKAAKKTHDGTYSPLPKHKAGQQGHGWWSGCVAWLKAMAMFSIPAVCYFINNK